MVNCFLTGVQMNLEQAFVLNRREVRDLHDLLKERVASLRRLIDQFGPLDARDLESIPAFRNAKVAPKKHRLVCKTIATALAPGFPEIKLFIGWLEYQAHSRQTTLQGVRNHPLVEGAINTFDDKALLKAEKLGKRVLEILDNKRLLPSHTRKTIEIGIGVFHLGHNAEYVVKQIRAAITGKGDAYSLGMSPDDFTLLRDFISIPVTAKTPKQSASLSVVAR